MCRVTRGRTASAVKVTMELQTFLFQMLVTLRTAVQYLCKYGFTIYSDNLYQTCTIKWAVILIELENIPYSLSNRAQCSFSDCKFTQE
jgi:hypothetical protein